MTSVYEPDNFIGRVNLAASYMTKGRATTRTFDTCFEMYDGDVVACAIYRRAIKNPKLEAALPRYLSVSMRDDTLKQFEHVKTRDLPKEAAKMRAKAEARWQEQKKAQHAT